MTTVSASRDYDRNHAQGTAECATAAAFEGNSGGSGGIDAVGGSGWDAAASPGLVTPEEVQLIQVETTGREIDEKQQRKLPCKFFFMSGQCLRGDSCPYSHNVMDFAQSFPFPSIPFASTIPPNRAPFFPFVPPQMPFFDPRMMVMFPNFMQGIGFGPRGAPWTATPVVLPLPNDDASPSDFQHDFGDVIQAPTAIAPTAAVQDGKFIPVGAPFVLDEVGLPREAFFRTKPCSFFWHLGHCIKGNDCEFQHICPPGTPAPPLPPMRFPRGGRQCGYQSPLPADSVTAMMQTPAGRRGLENYIRRSLVGDFPRRSSPIPGPKPEKRYSAALYRSKPCRFWFERGTCLKGDFCNFSHDPKILEKVQNDEGAQQFAVKANAEAEHVSEGEEVEAETETETIPEKQDEDGGDEESAVNDEEEETPAADASSEC